MVDQKQIEKLDKRVGELEKSMSANYDALAAEIRANNTELTKIVVLLEGRGSDGTIGQVKNHETRITNLERWQVTLIAIYTTVTVLFGVISPILYNYFLK
jgi:hypothetical protein